MMIVMRDDWNLRQWHDFLLHHMDLRIGKDYNWAWDSDRNRWAIEFFDEQVETLVRLKTTPETI